DVEGAPDLDVTVDGLPDGVTYYAPTKTISGFPTRTGEYKVTVTATTAGGQLKASKEYTLRVTTAASIVTESLKDGLAGQAYDQAIETAGFPAATVTVDGLPDGLEYKDGKITGAPKTAGTSQVTVTASNGVGEKDVKTFKLTVNETPAISTESLAAAQTGAAYSADVTVTGTPAPKVDVSGLPAGLGYKDGKIAGTPTESGEFTVVVSATNGTADPVTRELKLTVNAPASIVTDALADGIAGQEYAQPIETAGFPAATVTVEGLPEGLSYKDGKIAGTPKTAGTYKVTVKASNGIGDAASKTLTLTVDETPAISTESLAAAQTGVEYSADVTVTGTPAADVTVSGLPAGLSYKDGKITGTPAESGAFTVTVKASNKAGSVSKDLKLTVNAPASIETGSLADATVGQAYTQSILTSGFPAATVEVSGLPEGLGFDAVSNAITGTPKAAGTATVTVTASNGIGEKVVKDFELKVNGVPASVETSELPATTVGSEYAADITVAGTPAPTVDVSGLPAGLEYKDGKIQGAPTESGEFTVSVKAENGIGAPATKDLKLTVNAPASIETDALADGIVGQAYSQKVETAGFPAATVVVSGLPEGLSYADGQITGTPKAAGTATVTVTASNGIGDAASKTLTLTVNQAAAVTTTELPAATQYTAYSADITATGSPAPSVTVEGDLPAGLTYADGKIQGTPTQTGEFKLTVKAGNGVAADATAELTLTVAAIPAQTVYRVYNPVTG
ncbi:putative Ig domain-containing protein, partial [Pseudoscardovia radai]|uniref:putative Ig domain-containing protein n=1 Tax=Pseudoscardovia radai TaxID=987066 RepID=UPI003992CBEF